MSETREQEQGLIEEREQYAMQADGRAEIARLSSEVERLQVREREALDAHNASFSALWEVAILVGEQDLDDYSAVPRAVERLTKSKQFWAEATGQSVVREKKLEAEVERLTKERQTFLDDATEWELENVTLTADLENVRFELEEARKDTERLDWLEGRKDVFDLGDRAVDFATWNAPLTRDTSRTIREAIDDAARSSVKAE